MVQPAFRQNPPLSIVERHVYAPGSSAALSIITVPVGRDAGSHEAVLDRAGFRALPIVPVERERLLSIIALSVVATHLGHIDTDLVVQPEDVLSRSPEQLALLTDRITLAQPDIYGLVLDLFRHSYVPVPRSPGLVTRSLDSILASGPPLSAWLALDPWQAALITLGMPFYMVLIGAARGVSEGVRDRLYEAITGRQRQA